MCQTQILPIFSVPALLVFLKAVCMARLKVTYVLWSSWILESQSVLSLSVVCSSPLSILFISSFKVGEEQRQCVPGATAGDQRMCKWWGGTGLGLYVISLLTVNPQNRYYYSHFIENKGERYSARFHKSPKVSYTANK